MEDFYYRNEDAIYLIVKHKSILIDGIEDEKYKKLFEKVINKYCLTRLIENQSIKQYILPAVENLYKYVYKSAKGECENEELFSKIDEICKDWSIEEWSEKYKKTLLLLKEKRQLAETLEEYYLSQLDVIIELYSKDIDKLFSFVSTNIDMVKLANSKFISESMLCYIIETAVKKAMKIKKSKSAIDDIAGSINILMLPQHY